MPAKKILIVDDEQELVKTIQIRLEQEGYKVVTSKLRRTAGDFDLFYEFIARKVLTPHSLNTG